jgi:hypothetical protein
MCVEIEKNTICKLEVNTQQPSTSITYDNDDDWDCMRRARHIEQRANAETSNLVLTHLDNQRIKYTECNRIVTIVHPISNISIRRSTVKSNTFINGKWVCVDLDDIAHWYHSFDGIIHLCNYCTGFVKGICRTIDNYIFCKICNSRTKIHTTGSETMSLITDNLKMSTTRVQKKKWNSLLELMRVGGESFIHTTDSCLRVYNQYRICIIHPITKQEMNYHLKCDYIHMPNRHCYLDANKYEYIIKHIRNWLSDTPNKLENIKKWANQHPHLKELLYLLSMKSFTDNMDNDNVRDIILRDIIHWLNSFDNKLQSLIDYDWSGYWKLDNLINWLKGNGRFNRCFKCNCIYSYTKCNPTCINKYCK